MWIPSPEKEARKTLDEAAKTEARAMEIKTKSDIEIERIKQEQAKIEQGNAEADKLIWEINGINQGWLMEQMQQENANGITDDLIRQIWEMQ